MKLFHGDCLDYLRECGQYEAIFADPPDNLGLPYSGFKDNNPLYYDWLELLVRLALEKCKVFWLSYYWEHDLEVKRRAYWIKPHWAKKTFIWRYTFGQHNERDCGSGFRYILRFARPDWKPNVQGIRVESERQRLGDSRANPNGRIPDDVWDFNLELDEWPSLGLDAPGVWDEFPRVVGNSSERRSWHPTQHPEGLIERIMRMSSTSTFLDCFVGSGTSFRVGKRLGLNVTGCELSDVYVEHLRKEHNDYFEGS